MSKIFTSIGLMSGTSMDGIDLAMIKSNGSDYIKLLHSDYLEYPASLRNKIRTLIYDKVDIGFIKEVENDITLLHANLVNNFLLKNNIGSGDVDLIGCHGHTIYHDPNKLSTWQIINAQLLALKTNIKTIADFRNRDVLEGGEGAPLVPIYHYFLFSQIAKPTLIVNIGGVANVTYFSEDLSSLIAFDLCFGNAPSNDLMLARFNQEYDDEGNLASRGKSNEALIKQALSADIFNKKIPRSFSRNDFDEVLKIFSDLPAPDILANYAQIIAECLAKTIKQDLPDKPKQIVICGGGVKNKNLLRIMQKTIPEIPILTAQDCNFNADSIEAEAFAFLAIRRALNLPSSFPHTTATKNNNGSIGGVIFEP